jgi:hypothetical protein
MKFAKIVFWIAALWGFLTLTPLYFIFDTIGRQDPPPITHPAFYYGFIGTALAWQFAFVIIGRDPIRFRPLILPSVFEKFSYAIALIVLSLQHRVNPRDLVFCAADLLFGTLFIAAFLRTSTKPTAHS